MLDARLSGFCDYLFWAGPRKASCWSRLWISPRAAAAGMPALVGNLRQVGRVAADQLWSALCPSLQIRRVPLQPSSSNFLTSCDLNSFLGFPATRSRPNRKSFLPRCRSWLLGPLSAWNALRGKHPFPVAVLLVLGLRTTAPKSRTLVLATLSIGCGYCFHGPRAREICSLGP